VWRSKFIVAGLAVAFLGLTGRAAYVQVFGNAFFQRRATSACAHAGAAGQPRPHLDRNGLLLASSVPAPSIWAIPEDVKADQGELRQLAKLLDMPLKDCSTSWARKTAVSSGSSARSIRRWPSRSPT
jgi:cell division protein FtsI (penicillin-binding protein 3)